MAAHLDRWLHRERNQVSDVAASLLNVWSCASSLGLRERGGRTLLQKGESKDKLPTTFVMNVCPSHSRFQPISADIERSRKLSKEARFRALKAVARVRIPSGLPGEVASQRLFRVLSQFDHVRNRLSAAWTRGRLTPAAGLTASRPSDTAYASTIESTRCTFLTLAGARWRPVSQRCTCACVTSPSRTRPQRGRMCLVMIPS
jgi:hypothetical protein